MGKDSSKLEDWLTDLETATDILLSVRPSEQGNAGEELKGIL